MSFTRTFATPFFTGSSGNSTLVPHTLPVAINGHPFQVDLSGYKRTTLPMLRQSTDDNAEVSDASLNTEGPWRRSGDDWSDGGFQRTYDDNDGNRRRYDLGVGIDPWTVGQVSLLHDVEQFDPSVEGNVRVLYVSGWLYKIEGNVLSLALGSGAFQSVSTPLMGRARSFTTDGTYVYVADGANVWRTTVGSSTSTLFSSEDTDRVWFANGRLLGAKGRSLFELGAGGVRSDISAAFAHSFVWDSVAGAPSGIYAAGHAGDTSIIYFIGITDDGRLAPPVVAVPIPTGEIVNVLDSYVGLIFIGTNLGARLAVPGNNGSLAYSSFLDVGPVRDFAGYGSFVWFTCDRHPAGAGLCRLSLERLTDAEALVPAYAYDLAVRGVVGQVTSVVLVRGSPRFTVAGLGAYRPSADLVPEGVVHSGWITYGTTEEKLTTSVTISTLPLRGSVEVDLHTDVSHTRLGVMSRSGQTRVSLDSVRRLFDRAQLHIVLKRGANPTTGPTVLRWVFRALAAAERVDEIIVPLILADTVHTNLEGALEPMDPAAEFSFLKQLERGAEAITYQEGAYSYAVRLDAVELKPSGWSNDHSFFTGVAVVRLLTMESY